MKVRAGFVSNSSSSSFVLLGFEVQGMTKDHDELYDMAENLSAETGQDIRIYSGSEDGMARNVTACGILLGYGLEDGGTQETPILEAIRRVEELQKRLDQSSEIKVWAGSRLS